MESTEQWFGTNSVHSKSTIFSVLKNFVTLQPIKFWVLSYVLSMIIELFFGSNSILIDSVNLILFPFAVILIGTLANQFIMSARFFYILLYPTYRNLTNSQSIMFLLVVNVLKFIFFIIVWKYTFVLGVIGLVLSIYNAKKMSR
ncbi:hypothetical protein MKX54_19590 [Alkalihalobacillus sp. FSL R5-0424]